MQRFHRHSIGSRDLNGLATILNPIDARAETAAAGIAFDDEPADFLKTLREQKSRGTGR